MIFTRPVIPAVLASALLAACATGGDGEYRAGMDSTSPVRAAEVQTELGIGYFRRGEYQVALERLQRAVEHDSDHVRARVGLAMVYEALDDDRNAARQYRRAARLAPRDGATQNIYGVYLCRRGDTEEAQSRFQTALDDSLYDSPEVAHANAGICAMRVDDHERAEEHFREALQIRSDHPDALFHMAELSHQQGNTMSARAFLQRYEAVSDHDAESLLLGYRIEMALNNPSDALAYADRLEREYPDTSQADDLKREMPDD